jgi:hypothetical protein
LRSWIVGAAVAVGTVTAAISLSSLVEMFGMRIPQENLRTDYLCAIGWAFVLGVAVCLWPVRVEDKRGLDREGIRHSRLDVAVRVAL